MKILKEAELLTRGYVRKGGKTNRRQQRARILAFAEFCGQQGQNSLGQIGKAQVIAYWRTTRHLSDSTRYNHWRALVTLWQLSGKPGEPPKPNKISE
ncbi:hypothetical protein AB9R84_15630 (plasmid) [Oceanimonas smirnovii]|uniref:hypothetical protein n=1 Tax=Oceanimonas smirnovii TaxID=264574 RepID=UPI003AAADCBB